MAHIAAIRALVETVGDDLDLGLVALHRGRGGVRLALVHELPRASTTTQLAADVIVVADSDNWDIDTPALTVALRGNVDLQAAVSDARPRLALRHVRGSGAGCDARHDPAARHPLHDGRLRRGRRAHLARGRDPGLRRGAAARGDRACSTGVSPIGTGDDPRPPLGPAGDHGHRHRRAERRERLEHPVPTVRGADQRADRARPDAAGRLRARSRRTCAPTPRSARTSRSATSTWGNPFLVDTSGWAVAEAKEAMARGVGRPPWRSGVGGSIPFIADLVERVPGGADPGDRRRGPGLPGAQPQRVAAPRRLSSARSSPRRSCLLAEQLAMQSRRA